MPLRTKQPWYDRVYRQKTQSAANRRKEKERSKRRRLEQKQRQQNAKRRMVSAEYHQQQTPAVVQQATNIPRRDDGPIQCTARLTETSGYDDNEVEEEQQGRPDVTVETVQDEDSDGSSTEEEEEESNREDEPRTIFNLTDEALEQIILGWENGDTCDVSKSLEDALAVYYLNSGYKRFQEHLKFSKNHDEKPVDLDAVQTELLQEKLSNKELFERIKSYFKAHTLDARLLSCGACGIRQYESDNGSASIKYQKRSLESLPKVYRYDATQEEDFQKIVRDGAITVPSGELNDNHDPITIAIEPWKMISRYESTRSSLRYHLHPELVSIDPSGQEYTYLCPRCEKACCRKDNEKKQCHKLSIAAGVDFGNYERIKGLVAPNLHEQLIISKYRLYSCIIKVFPNGHGFQQMYSMHKMRGNQILFAHDSVDQVSHALATWTEEDIQDMMHVHFYNENGQNDGMARAAYGTNQLYARSHVLRQWFTLLQHTNLNYTSIEQGTIERLITNVTNVVQEKQDNPIFISDKESVNHEKQLGSDVSGAQQFDGMATSYNQQNINFENNVNEEESQSLNTSKSNMPMRTHYVAPSPEALLQQSDLRKQLETFNLRKLMEDTKENNASCINSNNNISETVNPENLAFLQNLFGCPSGGKNKGRIVYSGRSCHPANELEPNDKLLTSTFPWIFPLGQCYGRSGGSLSQEQTNHLLLQFHQIPSKDRRLLGYLADVRRRMEVINSARFNLSGNDRAIAKVNDFLDRNDHNQILTLLKDDPTNKKIKDIWNDLKGILALIGGNVMYGALEASRCMTRTFETAKRYGNGCCFTTLSFDDINNIRGIRASMKTLDNKKFPATIGAPGEVQSLEDLMEDMKKLSGLQGNGVVPFDESRPWLNLHRSTLSKLAAENPIAYVMETKAILHHVLTILFGLPPEGFFGAYEGQSTRKTKYFKLRSNGKGIFGHILAYVGVIEDHAKGTLHFHIIFFGSITSYVLHDLSCVPDICETVADILDTFYKAKYSTMTNARNAVTRSLNKASNVPLHGEKLSAPPLLQRINPISQIESLEDRGTCSIERLESRTSNERVTLCFHEHLRTCRKGFHGRCGCRLAKKSGLCHGTKCVLLEPVSLEREDDGDDTTICVQLDDIDNIDRQVMTQLQESSAVPEKDKKPLFTVTDVPTDTKPTYKLRNPLHRTNEPVIVWELDRPKPNIKEVPGMQHFDLDTLRAPLSSENIVNMRELIIEKMKRLLRKESCTVGDFYQQAEGADKSPLWDFFENGDINKVKALYSKIVNTIETGNQYAVEHSIVLFYCTGSHNNTALLGGCEQARAAMFYIAPYMSKEKAPLSVCLTALEKARQDIEKFPSKADDQTKKRRERLTKHFVTRVVNKLNAHNELSDYQVAAYLINLPSLITSEQFQLSETTGATNYLKELQAKISLSNYETNKDAYFGHFKTFTVEKGQNDGDPDVKRATPVVACYFHRGPQLRHLSLSEYDSLIQVKEKPKTGKETKSKAFPFADDTEFYLCARYQQVLRAKQRTLIFKGKQPPYPGRQPDATCKTYRSWKKKADKYAAYMLTMFRPSEIFNGLNHNASSLCQKFQWKDLKDWVNEQQNNESVISKFRLMAIERRMHCLASDYDKKRMLSEYRARDRDLWSERTKLRVAQEHQRENWYRLNHNSQFQNEDEFQASHPSLTTRQNDMAYQINHDSISLQHSLRKALNMDDENNTTQHHSNDSTWNILSGDHDLLDSSFDWDAKADWVTDNHDANSTVPYTPRPQNNTQNPSASTPTTNHLNISNDTPNKKQTDIINLYERFLTDFANIHTKEPPPILMMTGAGGTGKSFVIHRLLKIGNPVNGDSRVWTTANNNLNAADIDGCTIASILKHPIEKKDNDNVVHNEDVNQIKKIYPAALSELQDRNVSQLRLLIIDEISNVTATKLGQLSRLFSEARGNNKIFGGIKVLLVGDYNQKDPIGEPALKTIFKHINNARNAISQNQAQCEQQHLSETQITSKSSSLFSKSEYNCLSDATLGCHILAETRWFELTEAERSKDDQHNMFLSEMYTIGTEINPSTFAANYALFNKETLEKDSPDERPLWDEAPAIVKTNKERIDINFLRAIHFAKNKNTYLFRWLGKPAKWEGKPVTEDGMEEAMKDPAFWEIFVADGPCYLSETICKKKKLCKGTRARYHSMIMSDKGENEFHAQSSAGLTIITLSEPPTGINVTIDDNKITMNPKVDWHGLEYEDQNTQQKKILVPIKPECQNELEKPVFIVPTNVLFRPSRVKISSSFPLQPGFAITVDKAQGQTLKRVIVCLSERDYHLTQFTYACVYVAMSRVREAKHCRILLKDAPTVRQQWESLVYLTQLKKQKSINAFFAGFSPNRENWIQDKWDEKIAFAAFKRT